MSIPNKWSEDQILELLNLWNVKRWSAARCAQRMGTTRSAVIGVVNRNRVRHDFKRGAKARVVRKSKEKPALAVKKIIVGPNGLQASTQNPEFKEPAPRKKTSQSCLIWDLETWNCRWPISGRGADTWFCGAVKSGETYCADHAKKAIRT